MPSPKSKPAPIRRKAAPRLRVCLYGDSHLGALRLAVNDGYKVPSDVDVTYFGADGPNFRKLRHVGDGVQADQELIENGHLVNTDGRHGIEPTDFDAIFFTGSRLKVVDYCRVVMPGRLHRDQRLSRAVQNCITKNVLEGCRSVRIARSLSANGTPFVAFSPFGFYNEGLPAAEAMGEENGLSATTKEDRDFLNNTMSDRMARWGLKMIPQPEQTVTKGCMTKIEYAVDGAMESGDAVHKNAAYGKLLLDQFFKSAEFQKLRKDRAATAKA